MPIILTYDDRRIVDDVRFSVVRETVDEFNLVIANVDRSDYGIYTCTVNTQPAIEKTVALTVLCMYN